MPASTPAADRPSLGFVGTGRLGASLALAAHAAGYHVVAVASRGGASAARLALDLPGTQAGSPAEVAERAEAVFLTVPDRAIRDVCAQLPWRAGQIVVHCAALDGPDALVAASAAGAHAGVFHPLQAFGDPRQAAALLRGATATVAGEAAALHFLAELAGALGCRTLLFESGDRALYHAAAVTASNSVVALLDVAFVLWESAGLDRADALAALLPLTRSAIAAVEALGTARGLTGPIVRGDTTTVARHLEAVRAQSPQAARLYAELALATLALAARSGRLDAEQTEVLRALLDRARGNTTDA